MNFVFQTPEETTYLELEQLKLRLAHEFPNVPPVPRKRFVMAATLADKVLAREKCTTIRYDKSAVEYPADSILPLYSLQDGQAHEDATCLADLQILSVRYTPVCNLTEADARCDGFDSRGELMETLQRFYGRLAPTETVCIYAFRLAAAIGIHEAGAGRHSADMVSV